MTSLLVICVSVALLVYWARSSAMLILRTASENAATTAANLLESRRELLAAAQGENLPLLGQMLQKDAAVLRNLLHLTGGPAGFTIRHQLLMLNFRLSAALFAVSYRLNPSRAKSFLAEMSATVEYLSNSLGQTLATESRRA